jgi:hypothetical protein
VEQIQWPDVDSSTSEVDACRRGRYDGHERIIDCLSSLKFEVRSLEFEV